VHSGASRQVPAHGNRHTIGKRERLHGVFRSSAGISRFAKFLRALAQSSFCLDRTAGRQAHRGGLRSAWRSKKQKLAL
jgi:hypothetical protein